MSVPLRVVGKRRKNHLIKVPRLPLLLREEGTGGGQGESGPVEAEQRSLEGDRLASEVAVNVVRRERTGWWVGEGE